MGKIATAIWMIENGNVRYGTELTNLIMDMTSEELQILKHYTKHGSLVNLQNQEAA